MSPHLSYILSDYNERMTLIPECMESHAPARTCCLCRRLRSLPEDVLGLAQERLGAVARSEVVLGRDLV